MHGFAYGPGQQQQSFHHNAFNAPAQHVQMNHSGWYAGAPQQGHYQVVSQSAKRDPTEKSPWGFNREVLGVASDTIRGIGAIVWLIALWNEPITFEEDVAVRNPAALILVLICAIVCGFGVYMALQLEDHMAHGAHTHGTHVASHTRLKWKFYHWFNAGIDILFSMISFITCVQTAAVLQVCSICLIVLCALDMFLVKYPQILASEAIWDVLCMTFKSPPSAAKELFKRIDSNHDGKVSPEEFEHAFENHMLDGLGDQSRSRSAQEFNIHDKVLVWSNTYGTWVNGEIVDKLQMAGDRDDRPLEAGSLVVYCSELGGHTITHTKFIEPRQIGPKVIKKIVPTRHY